MPEDGVNSGDFDPGAAMLGRPLIPVAGKDIGQRMDPIRTRNGLMLDLRFPIGRPAGGKLLCEEGIGVPNAP